ncbi:MAG: sigma-54-dependent Fis family transcriptional regulator [Alphaproteobacteria bacterium]|nr:sigma-54-dependent Fis family transcriptional regulator [Alphaproteobacteria bacterium]
MAHEVLIVDDEADIRMLIGGILEDEGYTAREARDSTEAIEAVRKRPPSLVILDVWLEGSPTDGIDVLRAVKQDHPNLPVVMISGHGTVETAVAAIKEGAYDFIEKPFKSSRLLLVAERAIEAARLKRENLELRLRAGGERALIGVSAATHALRQAIERVAPSGSRVLITGPAGSGKELAARVLHAQSRRAEAPFIVVNCAAMSPDRMEIELFGTERALGNGEGGRKIGFFEQAHGGTLFLDEVADMPLETQGKIVRVLQEQTFERLGGTRRVEVDVRVIASTNKDLAAEIESQHFREDLFYRLNVVPLHIPALRHRREDIPVLARHLLAHATMVSGLPARDLGEDALAALQSYDWPGNVRQLRNVIDWLLIMVPGDPRQTLRADMLPPEIFAITPAMLRSDKGGEMMSLPLRDAREMFEREYLMAQVNRFGGNISRTASFIGMERSALHRKLKLLGVAMSAERG